MKKENKYRLIQARCKSNFLLFFFFLRNYPYINIKISTKRLAILLMNKEFVLYLNLLSEKNSSY